MDIFKLEHFYRGWFIGDFEPSLLKQPFFEVGILEHKKGEYWPEHFHEYATEYNVLLKGRMTINDVEIKENDVFVINPKEKSRPEFLEDCKVLCVKCPSLPKDKHIVRGIFGYD